MPIAPDTVVPVLVLIGLSAGLSLGFRAVRAPGGAPGAAVFAAVLAGLLLGGPGLGLVAPDVYERWFLGGAPERQALDHLADKHQQEQDALERTGVSPQAIAEAELAWTHERGQGEDRLARARAEHQRPMHMLVTALIAAGLACAALGVPRRRSRTPTDAWSRGIGVALVNTVFAALPTYLLAAWLLDLDWKTGVALSALVASGSAFSPMLRAAPEPARRPITRCVGVGVLVMSILTLLFVVPPGGLSWLMAPAAALVAAELVRAAFRLPRRVRRALRWVALTVFVPSAGASALLTPDVRAVVGSTDAALFVFASLALSGGGHFIGCWLGLMTFARDRDRAGAHNLAMEIHAGNFPMTQLCWAALLVPMGVFDVHTAAGAACVLGVAANALLPELLIDKNRRMLRRMVED